MLKEEQFDDSDDEEILSHAKTSEKLNTGDLLFRHMERIHANILYFLNNPWQFREMVNILEAFLAHDIDKQYEQDCQALIIRYKVDEKNPLKREEKANDLMYNYVVDKYKLLIKLMGRKGYLGFKSL